MAQQNNANSGDGHRAGPLSPPAQSLPLIFQHLKGDVRSLLFASCVSRDWRDAAANTPEVWQVIKFPRKVAKRVTNERLRSILSRSREMGVTFLDLTGCRQLTGQVVPDVLRALKTVPEKVSLKSCNMLTWRDARVILRHLQALFEQEVEAGRHAGPNHQEVDRCRLRSLKLKGIRLEGASPADFVALASLPVAKDLRQDVALCGVGQKAHMLARCDWCDAGHCLEHGPDMAVACVRCDKFGCLEHFPDMPQFRSCSCFVCDDCVEENPGREDPCHVCKKALCPRCDALEEIVLRPCTGGCLPHTNMICDECRLEKCICKCKWEDMTVEDMLRGDKYLVLCEECVQEREPTPQGDWGDVASTRYCDECGLLRKFDSELGTDDSSEDEGWSDDSPQTSDASILDDGFEDTWFDEVSLRTRRDSDSETESADED